MPSPLYETRTLDDLVAALLDAGLVARVEDLAGAERLVGWESVVVRTPGGWIFRFGRLGADAFARELRVLSTVDGRLGVPTPRVEAVDEGRLVMAYRTITGSGLDLARLLALSPAQRQPLTRSLAGALAALGELEPAVTAAAAVPRHDPGAMVDEVRAVRHDLAPGDRRAVDALLAEWASCPLAAPASEPVLLHGDFHPGNMVFAGPTGPLAGLWDFSCVEIGDPSADLRYLCADSAVLAGEVAAAYAELTGRRLELTGARLLAIFEDVTDAVAERRPVAEVLRRWNARA